MMVMDTEAIVSYVQTVAAPLLITRGIELVELTYRPQGRQHMLQLLVQTPAGITLEQCAELNRALSHELDAAGLLEEPYLLEVASPGLDRPLTTQRDFKRAAGRLITAELQEPFSGQRQVVGRVVSAEASTVTLEIARWGTVTLPLANIARATMKLRW